MKKYSIDSFCETIQEKYKKKGLDCFELAIAKSKALAIQTRNVKLENIESSSDLNITLNLMIGKKHATLNANNLEGLDAEEFLEKGKFMAESSPEDPFSGLPEMDEYANSIKDLDLEDKKFFAVFIAIL